MKSLYALLLEKLARDIALSTAIGVTAGMRAALADTKDNETIEARVERELDAVLGEVMQPPSVIAATVAAADSVSLPKRGPGRPRKPSHSEDQP